MDELLPPLTKKLDSAYQSLKREQLHERGLNLVRHVLRVVYEIENSDEHRESPVPHFSEFVTSKVMANPTGHECLNKIRESSNAEMSRISILSSLVLKKYENNEESEKYIGG